MRILLVRPHLNKKVTTVKNIMFGEPMGIECVATICKELNHEVLLVDFMAESKSHLKRYLKKFKPDMVGITSQCADITNTLYLAEKIKKYDRRIIITVGGIQASLSPEAYFSRNVDYVFKATTRENYRLLLEQIENDTDEEIMGIYARRRLFQSTLDACTNEYVKPDREMSAKYRKQYKYAGYQPYSTIQTSYGCRNKCKFCIRRKIEGALTMRPIEEVVDEIEEIKEKNIMICDSDFLISEPRLIEFCDMLEKRNIQKTFICYGSVNSILEKEYLFERLYKNGIRAVIVGLESFSDEWLKKYNKSATIEENFKAVAILKKNHIATWGTFILHPDFSKQDFKDFAKHLKTIKPEMISFTPFIPHFLTEFYDEYKDRLIYPKDDYEKYSFGDVVVYPSQMSLRQYNLQVIKLGIPANFNMTTVKYSLKEFPLSHNLKLIFSFDSIIKNYTRNILLGKMK